MPAPVINLDRGFYLYTSDNGNQYTIATLDANNAAQGTPQTPLTNPLAYPAYPRGFRTRVIRGEALVSSVLYRTKLPVFSPTDTLWTTSGTFTKWGTSYGVTSRIGERQTPRS